MSSTSSVYNRSAVSRYIQLSTIFRQHIESGRWPIGEQIPTVAQLADEWQVARATIRQALGILEQEGLIERFRAKGTFVTHRPQLDLWCEVPTDWSGLLLSPEGVDIEILSTGNDAQPPTIEHAVGKIAPSYRYWRRRHSRNGQRYYVGNAYIDERWARQLSDEAFDKKTSLRVLKEIEGLHLNDIHQTLTVRTADVELSNTLDVPLNFPLVHVARTGIDEDSNIVFVGDGLYRGDVIRLDVKVST